MKERLSVVVITKDEESNIRECLDCVKWADEIIVVDDISRDATMSICREYTDKVFSKKMEGFGAQKQFGIDKATGDWILILDADERLSPELQARIRSVLEGGSQFDGYKIWRKSFYLGVWIRHCGWYNPVLRLFRRGKGRSDLKYVHESIIVSGGTGEIREPILHYSYTSIDQHLQKVRIYTDHDARSLFERGVRINATSALWYFMVKPTLIFWKKYACMGGFLDGMRGFLISAFTAIIVFLNYAKVWELQKDLPAER